MRLLTAPWVVPITSPPIPEGALAVAADGTIVEVGPRAAIRRAYANLREERAEGALLPGLVNAHAHLELSALAGKVPGGGGLIAWATSLMEKLRTVPPQEKIAAAIGAAQAAHAAGTVAVGDVANSLDAVAAIDGAGLHGIVFHELVGSREARTRDALADATRERSERAARTPWPTRVGYTPAPHAPYSASPQLLRRIFAAAGESGHPTSVHVAEDVDEIALLLDGTGGWADILATMGVPKNSRTPRMTPVAYLESLGAFAGPRPPLLVHMVHAAEKDRALAHRHNATVVLCPRSNQHIQGRTANARLFINEGLRVAIGTDSLASNSSLSLWSEIQLLAAQNPGVPPQVWIAIATRGGALGLDLPQLGDLAPGRRPGIIDVALDNLAAPMESLVATGNPRVRWMAQA